MLNILNMFYNFILNDFVCFKYSFYLCLMYTRYFPFANVYIFMHISVGNYLLQSENNLI